MNRALLLAGGGARGAFQVGMLEELVANQGLDFQTLRGVSVGALNAAFLAQAPAGANSQAELARQVAALHGLWTTEIQGNDSIYEKRAGMIALALGADSLYSLAPLKALIEKHISLAALTASGRDFAVGAVSLVTGRYDEWKPAQTPGDFMERFLASASIPVVFPFVDLEAARDVLVDGGVRNVTPLTSVFRSHPDEIWILLASRIDPGTKGLPDAATEEHDYEQWQDNAFGTKVGGFDVLKRTLDILTDEVALDDIRGAISWNRVAAAIERLAALHDAAPPQVAAEIQATRDALDRARKRSVPLFVLAPRVWFDEDHPEKGSRNPSTEFAPHLIAKAIAHGRAVAADRRLWVWPHA
jgi:NTE family protein